MRAILVVVFFLLFGSDFFKAKYHKCKHSMHSYYILYSLLTLGILIRMAQSGQVGGKMSEEELVGLLEKISDANASKVRGNKLCLKFRCTDVM